jgi:hypothetical protein
MVLVLFDVDRRVVLCREEWCQKHDVKGVYFGFSCIGYRARDVTTTSSSFKTSLIIVRRAEHDVLFTS